MECKINWTLLGGHLPPARAGAGEHVGTQNVHKHQWEMGQEHEVHPSTEDEDIAFPFHGAQHPRALWEHAEGNPAASGLQISSYSNNTNNNTDNNINFQGRCARG